MYHYPKSGPRVSLNFNARRGLKLEKTGPGGALSDKKGEGMKAKFLAWL